MGGVEKGTVCYTSTFSLEKKCCGENSMKKKLVSSHTVNLD